MAEPFSVVAGAIGIASAFAACVDCFEYVQFGRHFGRDFQTSQLALDCARLRLTRWGESVNIYDDPKLGRQDATEIQLANDVLLQILVLFADTEGTSKKYKLTAKADEDLSASSLKDLLEQIVSLLDEIERLFPAPRSQTTLVQQEIAKIGDRQSLELIADAATGVDSLLQKAVKEVIAGHQYSNIQIKGQAHTGDAYSSDWSGVAIGASHKYDGVKVEEGGKALVGNKYGGKDFWR
ncbi:hypothetical protein VE00_07427 [Pseudogymnoascus sp. WSF 3629]|nr:hypothetical protein VE00_07427 [Pseudogymnoascus sp. WSF 3629]